MRMVQGKNVVMARVGPGILMCLKIKGEFALPFCVCSYHCGVAFYCLVIKLLGQCVRFHERGAVKM